MLLRLNLLDKIHTLHLTQSLLLFYVRLWHIGNFEENSFYKITKFKLKLEKIKNNKIIKKTNNSISIIKTIKINQQNQQKNLQKINKKKTKKNKKNQQKRIKKNNKINKKTIKNIKK